MSLPGVFTCFQALIASQTRLREMVDGFRFVLGFSGWYYLNGDEEEDDGDRKLIGKALSLR